MNKPLAMAALSAIFSFSLTVSDIRPYVDDRLWTQDLDSTRCATALSELRAEVTDILDAYDANGYLEPALFTIGITGHWILFGNPGEEIQILSETLPFLPSALRSRLTNYLYSRIRAKNPLNTGFYMVGGNTWGANALTGNRRSVMPSRPPLIRGLSCPTSGLPSLFRPRRSTRYGGTVKPRATGPLQRPT